MEIVAQTDYQDIYRITDGVLFIGFGRGYVDEKIELNNNNNTDSCDNCEK